MSAKPLTPQTAALFLEENAESVGVAPTTSAPHRE